METTVKPTPECEAQLLRMLRTFRYGKQKYADGLLSKCPAGTYSLDLYGNAHIEATVSHAKHEIRRVKFGNIISDTY